MSTESARGDLHTIISHYVHMSDVSFNQLMMLSSVVRFVGLTVTVYWP